MTPEQAREAAAVMLAWADGKKIQRRLKSSDNRWEQATEPMWSWGNWEYRVAPEPWQGKVWVHPDGSIERAMDGHNVSARERFGSRLITVKEAQDD